ncbi:uncharacterized protein LOC127529778 [Erpetoichthys calabaricus]|uniref:uncharacterized protein LOC127529778 n=1 Tax=Erpetoichthys calabaricus TaxID=27687 RepID=UPI002234516E|nr:uncharacterized protein LOC127529778 [Erpetoichthys calabaricus]
MSSHHRPHGQKLCRSHQNKGPVGSSTTLNPPRETERHGQQWKGTLALTREDFHWQLLENTFGREGGESIKRHTPQLYPRQLSVREEIKGVVEKLEVVLQSLKEVHQEMKEMLHQIDLLTSHLDLSDDETCTDEHSKTISSGSSTNRDSMSSIGGFQLESEHANLCSFSRKTREWHMHCPPFASLQPPPGLSHMWACSNSGRCREVGMSIANHPIFTPHNVEPAWLLVSTQGQRVGKGCNSNSAWQLSTQNRLFCPARHHLTVLPEDTCYECVTSSGQASLAFRKGPCHTRNHQLKSTTV